LGAEVPVKLDTNAIVLLDVLLDEEIVTVPASVRYNIGKFHGFAFVDMGEEHRAMIRQYCRANA
jgi:hypothetical protein